MQRLMLVAMLAIPLVPHRASADPKSDARAHVVHATELHKQNKFAEALEELKTAYALDPQPQLLFAMGQLHVALGQCTQAIPFYERFLATHPDDNAAGATREAIDTCKRNPPSATGEPTPPPAPTPPPQPAPPVRIAHEQRPEGRPWYGDKLADGLVISGVVAGVVGIAMYRDATSARDDADHAATYEAYARLIDTAHSDRTYAIVFGAAGVALVAGGVAHYVLSRDTATDVAVTPLRGGAAVGVAGRF